LPAKTTLDFLLFGLCYLLFSGFPASIVNLPCPIEPLLAPSLAPSFPPSLLAPPHDTPPIGGTFFLYALPPSPGRPQCPPPLCHFLAPISLVSATFSFGQSPNGLPLFFFSLLFFFFFFLGISTDQTGTLGSFLVLLLTLNGHSCSIDMYSLPSDAHHVSSSPFSPAYTSPLRICSPPISE